MKLNILFMAIPLLIGCSQPINKPSIEFGNTNIMSAADFGLKTNMRSWCAITDIKDATTPIEINDDYEMLEGKRKHCHNEGSEVTYTLVNDTKDTLLIQFRQYKDGFAFRYIIPSIKPNEKLISEQTSYNVPSTAKRWMQQYDRQGYERFYPECSNGVSPESEKITTWGYPALIEVTDSNFILISEANIQRSHCGSYLSSDSLNRNKYIVTYPESDIALNENCEWESPWRIVIAGTLTDIVESTLITDVSDPCKISDTSWIKLGLASWIYWAYNHGSQDYSILKEYVDLASYMKWSYTLIDAEWDRMTNGGDIESIVNYANSQGVKPIIWYNSTTNWVGEWAPTPQGLLNDPSNRKAEYKRIADMGVSGVKIDFFAGDKVETMDYYLDLLEDAAEQHLLVNFHGATIPRGWQRTYPNLVSMEAVFGAEWYNNNGILTNKAARHNATLPFTRNVIGSMDYTPGTFTDSQHKHITTHAHELALTILFESGIQHMPDRPSAYKSLPQEVQNLLSTLPSAWDDTKLLAGYPGENVVLARKKGDYWYIAGINGLDEEQTISFSTASLNIHEQNCTFITDGETQTDFIISNDKINSNVEIKCKPRGGFVIKL